MGKVVPDGFFQLLRIAFELRPGDLIVHILGIDG